MDAMRSSILEYADSPDMVTYSLFGMVYVVPLDSAACCEWIVVLRSHQPGFLLRSRFVLGGVRAGVGRAGQGWLRLGQFFKDRRSTCLDFLVCVARNGQDWYQVGGYANTQRNHTDFVRFITGGELVLYRLQFAFALLGDLLPLAILYSGILGCFLGGFLSRLAPGFFLACEAFFDDLLHFRSGVR